MSTCARSARRRTAAPPPAPAATPSSKRIYAGQLELPEAIAQGAMMLDLAAEKPSALLCFERDPAVCHRSLLLDAVAPGAEVEHLFA